MMQTPLHDCSLDSCSASAPSMYLRAGSFAARHETCMEQESKRQVYTTYPAGCGTSGSTTLCSLPTATWGCSG